MNEGEELVRATRYTIEHYISSRKFDRYHIEEKLAKFHHPYGVFVTIEHYPTRTLRGCIGFPRPVGPLRKSLVDAAVAASTEDPRFVPVSHHEFDDMVVEVSILSTFERVKGKTPEARRRDVKVGRNGLILEYGYHSSLLLPIVAVEQGWNNTQFLENVCIKAGLPSHLWQRNDVVLHKFTAQVFRELSPRGPVEEIVFK